MGKLVSLAAAAALLAVAGAAQAQDSVEVSGDAPAVCTLPTTWTFVSSSPVGVGGTFSGTTWTIPDSAFADASGGAVTGGEFAIRIRGNGYCNTSHTIRIQSLRGGLTSGAVGATPPSGFANRRVMAYEAQWSSVPLGNSGNGALGPKASFTPTTPGQQSNPATYTVTASLPPPGARAFDIRMGLQRGAIPLPLVAGTYSDQITVTLTANP